jgi:glyoxalase/bleomycin resistance protein/dioxygenase superfamily protein
MGLRPSAALASHYRGVQACRMICGVHAQVHSSDPRATRAFFRDALGLPGVDIGEGQWICTLTEANVACTRPGSEDPADAAGLSLLCEDLRGTVAGLKSRGVEFTHEIENHGYALVTYLTAPGGVTVMLFEPRYRKRAPSRPTSKPKRAGATRMQSAKPASKRSR